LASLAGGGCAFFDVLKPASMFLLYKAWAPQSCGKLATTPLDNTLCGTFRSICKNKKEDMIAYWEKLDGVCVFISNHT